MQAILLCYNRVSLRNAAVIRTFVLCLTIFFIPQLSWAEISALGDISPDSSSINPLGTTSSIGPLTVGITDVGGIFIDVAFDPYPLISDSGVVGRHEGSIGRLSMDGFPSDWLIGVSDVAPLVDPLASTANLIVGDAGTGVVDLFDSAKVQVGDNSYDENATPRSSPPADVVAGDGVTVLGREATGFGQMTITNVGARLVTAELIVGDLGVGDIVVSSTGVIYSADAIIGNQNGSIGTVTLNDSGTRWTVGDSETPSTLNIGNGNGDLETTSAYGTLNINTNAVVQTTGVVTVNKTGQINFGGGTLRDVGVQGVGDSTIVNNGVIRGNSINTIDGPRRGDGFIDAAMSIGSSGELRNAATLASEREYMRVSGAVTNAGLIESIGGEMEFQELVTNDHHIVARDAIMRFQGGLTNNFSLAMGGNTTINGDITNVGGGDIHVLTGSDALIVGDLTFSSSSVLGLSVGDSPGTLEVLGLTDLGDAMLSLEYSAGVKSQSGDSYQILSSGDGLIGMFSNPMDKVTADGRIWDITGYGTSAIFVTATDSLVSTVLGDFDGDTDVDGFDFLAWQRGFGNPYDANDLADWETNYGTPAPLAAATALGAVPEPSSVALLLLGGVLIAGRRRFHTSS